MPYVLRGNLSFCQVDGRLVFLDIENDRYFGLSSALERAFREHQCDGASPVNQVGGLLERNILVEAGESVDSQLLPDVPGAIRSALEQGMPIKRFRIATLLDVFVDVCSVQWQLRTRSLKAILDELAAYRRKRTLPLDSTSSPRDEQHVLDAAAEFRRARLYVPIDTCCLLDSIAMVTYLAKRRLYASIIFGVTGEPFSAHCWVQLGEMVLNDTLGHVDAHTRILVV